MMLMNDNSTDEEMNCSNTLQQMQLFDLSRPKDIMTFIEVEPDNCTETNTNPFKKSIDEAKRACPVGRKRKSMKENKSKMKNADSIDKDEKRSRIENVYNQLISNEHNNNIRNAMNIQPVQDVSVSNYTQIYYPLATLTNMCNNQDQRVQVDKHNFDQRQISNNVSVVNITNQASSSFPPEHTPVSSMNAPNLIRINHGLNVIIEHVLNFLTNHPQNYTKISERLTLFQRCYTYVVHYCLDPDLNRDYKVFNLIALNVVSMAQTRSHNNKYINQKHTRQLLDAMFEWCRQKRSIERKMEQIWQPHLPAYTKNHLNNIFTDHYSYGLKPQIQTNLPPSFNNSNSSTINNDITPATNKDQTCLFMLGAPGKEISINVDTSLYNILKDNPETIHEKLHQRVNIEEKDTLKLTHSPIITNSGLTTPSETGITGQNIREIQNQSETSRSSVSRDSGFISPSHIHSNLEDRLTNSVQQTDSNEDVTPIITHVTSLNTNVFYITKGLCSVCKKVTNKRCIGCYKIYYCSRDCQFAFKGFRNYYR